MEQTRDPDGGRFVHPPRTTPASHLERTGQIHPSPPPPPESAPGGGAGTPPAQSPPPSPPHPPGEPAGPVPLPAPPRPGRRGLILPALTIVGALAAGTVGGRLGASSIDSGGTAPTDVPEVAATSASFDGETLDIASVLARLQRSIVSIETTVQSRRGPFVTEGEGAGTGVVIDDSGHILTNAHVLQGATTVEVTLPGDGGSRHAEVVAGDSEADIAVLEVEDTSGLVPAELAVPDGTAIGDEVVAIGNALALEGGMTVTEGIVSAMDRSLDTGQGTLTGLIQTDAAISSGNSGGPLVNAEGQVIGINTAVAASSGTVQASNIGFAISIDRALAVAEDLLSVSS